MVEAKGTTQDVQTLAAEIHARLQAKGNPEPGRVATSYTPTAMEVLGVAVPDIRSVARDVGRRLSPNPPKDTDGRREESGRGVRELQGK